MSKAIGHKVLCIYIYIDIFIYVYLWTYTGLGFWALDQFKVRGSGT